MKRFLIFLCILISLTVFAGAETIIPLTEIGERFSISMRLEDDENVLVQFDENTAGTDLTRVVFTCDHVASVTLSIAPSELYAGCSMNDFSEEEIDEICSIAGMQYADPVFTTDITVEGNKYVHICSNEAADIDSIFTVYEGCFVELTICRSDFSALEENDVDFMKQLLYGLTFTKIGESN